MRERDGKDGDTGLPHSDAGGRQGPLRHVIDPIVAFTPERWNATVQR